MTSGYDQMPFPESKRIRYSRNPLAEVFCQLHFPRILKIDVQVPSEFQEAVRADYPGFDSDGRDHAAPDDVLRRALSGQSRDRKMEYHFVSADQKWRITLAGGFVGLATLEYVQWEAFRARLEKVLDVLRQTYQPAYFTRVSLRYTDVIQRSLYGLHDEPWSNLIEGHALGELGTDIAPNVEEAQTSLVIRLKGVMGRVGIRHGLANVETDDNEECYAVDADFFNDDRTEVNDALGLLNEYNKKAGRLFRWYIRPLLHDAMEPTPIAE